MKTKVKHFRMHSSHVDKSKSGLFGIGQHAVCQSLFFLVVRIDVKTFFAPDAEQS